MRVVRCFGAEYIVNGVKEIAELLGALRGASLEDRDKVFKVGVNSGGGFSFSPDERVFYWVSVSGLGTPMLSDGRVFSKASM